LIIASTQGHTALVAVLLEHHATVDAVDNVSESSVCIKTDYFVSKIAAF